MTENNKIPVYNLKAVVQETGIKPDTLRAWERRYGLPEPERTSGHHRLYSDYDVQILKWLVARQEEGLSISRAVDHWRQLESEGESPLEYYVGDEQQEPLAAVVSGETLKEMRQGFVSACLEFNELTARQILAQAFAQFPMEAVCFQVLQKSLQEVGIGWFEGRVTVQQEHFTSALAIRQLEALHNAAPLPHRSESIVIACAPHEQHVFSALLLALMLRHRGWHVIYLGADVPPVQLETTLQEIKPDLLIVTALTLYTASTLLDMANLAQENDTLFSYGGAVFAVIEGVKAKIPGNYLGSDLQAAPRQVELLINQKVKNGEVQPVSIVYQETLDHFTRQRSAIEADVLRCMAGHDLAIGYLKNANQDFGDNIQAALKLGDIHFLEANVQWVHGLLANFHYRMPFEAVEPYLSAYKEAAEKHLDERGQLLIEWLLELDLDLAGNAATNSNPK